MQQLNAEMWTNKQKNSGYNFVKWIISASWKLLICMLLEETKVKLQK